MNGTRFEPKKPKRLFKEPKIEKARRLAKILFREPTIEELKLELMKLRTQAALGTLDNPGKIRAIRKTIARILTVLRERELGRERGKR